jgi:ParB family transcriptional regulator, chromosome partitioning protein
MQPATKQFVYSAIFGLSADVIPQILKIHVKPGSLIADLTWQNGSFWKKVKPAARFHGNDGGGDYAVIGSDIRDCKGALLRSDARETPYRDSTFDCVVIDPPFGNFSTKPRRDGIKEQYNLETCMTPDGVKALYEAMIREADRILKPKGVLICKCQDGVNAGKQQWVAEHIFWYAKAHFFEADGRFVMIPPGDPQVFHKDRPQQHARCNFSMFWVFKKGRGK